MPGQQQEKTEHTDVLIIGAGLSGIGIARYLQENVPDISYTILESRSASGGTWDLFRYPGIRSDSDLHTFGYEFKPWVDDKAIAGADSILGYLRETAAENGIDQHIRYQHRVKHADWSSEEARWFVEVEQGEGGEPRRFVCKWLFSAAGYYRYDEGYAPSFPGSERFRGELIHPQHWPENLDYAGKRVLVIGSGATAITLVPAMTEKAAHVTMLQRTPSYVMSLPSEDAIAKLLAKVLPAEKAYALTRGKNITLSRNIWRFCQKYPKAARRLIRRLNKRALPKGYPVDEHFNPPYNPWDQRLCVVPDGDLFQVISQGKASVVTDHIDTFTEKGVRLKSGQELEADIIVTATGLNLQLFGGIRLSKDGRDVDLSRTVAYKGMMLSGLPNFAFAIGYTNASWTLKVGLVAEHLCRLLNHMKQHGYDVCCPELPSPDMPTRPLLDFDAGYVQRSIDMLPRQGEHAPWLMPMDYRVDSEVLRHGPVTDPALKFSSVSATGKRATSEAEQTEEVSP
ncbi:Predicted flavoprotein CzcO associated with the cation diffusion facilitator CzcD [Marinobacter daqiaonensis]|uniref:Predicted flavoprotein CzcO associated with the cation diffusion facilitator CzcD n=1 Tax=Marinobacter daqiaonensis TaxID=650891 RepID=A0A1I6H193_9GAMM|nr:NAD(P)/FAD-dependent oxidoreductase [Marinobacter daqiaonensis]SFR48101.1 Predicted flavoprotein CzcO associated with the cation diffusion facilitator CzcD [Marinobacter daqiaonensis]